MRLAFAVLALWLSGCASSAPSSHVSVPHVPAWRPPATATTFTALEIAMHCASLAPAAVVDVADSTFAPVDHEWLVAAAAWSWEFGKATGLRYTAESFDCDDFATGFAFAANISASRHGVKAQPLIARIYVRQSKAFGGVPASGAHALNAFLSDRGVFVFEPQSRALVPLAEYPNRTSIVRVKIGG